MKLLKYSFAAMLAVVLATSCSDASHYDEYNSGNVAYSFEQGEFNTMWADGSEPETITLSVIRTSKTGDATVGLELTTDTPDRISIPATVEFKNGENVASFEVSISGLTVGKATLGTITFANDVNVSPSGNKKCDLTLELDYNWTLMGTGAFIDQFCMDEVFPVEIYNAQGFPIYRVMNPYEEWSKTEAAAAEWEDWLTGPYPEYLEFWETALADGTPVLNWNEYNCGLIYQGVKGQNIGVYPPYLLGKSMVNCKWLIQDGVAGLSPYYYVNGVGGWDYSGKTGVILIALPGYEDALE